MKIACLAPSQVPSTTANSIQVMKVCQSLAQIGHTVQLWLPGLQPRCWDELESHYGLTTRFSITGLRSEPSLKRYDMSVSGVTAAKKWGADMLYTWLPQAAWLASRCKLPALLELHDRPSGRLGPRLLRWFAASRTPHRLLFITHALRRALDTEFDIRVPDEHAIIAPDGVDLERYLHLPTMEELRSQLGLPQGLLSLYTGHLYPGRGMQVLEYLAQQMPQVNFVWLGGRPADVEHWRKRAASQVLSNLNVLGFIENRLIPAYQSAADALLMPYERVITTSSGGNTADICSPMKMFEYMAAGRAILSSDLPVLREVLNEENAILLPPDEPAVWVDALHRLSVDVDLRQHLGSRARVDVEQYTWQSRALKCFKDF
jgi:glycosyltransferase involved in cell wall biosynthesis